jgi:hypothetical protein
VPKAYLSNVSGEIRMMNARGLSRWFVPQAVRPVVLRAMLVTGVAVHAAPADACSIGIGLIWQSYPAREATAIPTNVAPILYTDGSYDVVSLRRADGAPVAVEVTAEDPNGYVLRPLLELEPLTDYELVYGPPAFSSRRVKVRRRLPTSSPCPISAPLGYHIRRAEPAA